jgi:hypothetical protein
VEGEEEASMSGKFTLITAGDFEEILNDSNEVIGVVQGLGKSAISCGLAGASLIRGCIEATDGDIEWWINLLRQGPDAIVAIPLPEGTTVGNGPKGKQ